MLINKKNCTSVENPDYLIRNPHFMCRNESGDFLPKKEVQAHHYYKPKPPKTIMTNAKFGMSKDSPFKSFFSECHALTKSLFDEKKYSAIDYSGTLARKKSLLEGSLTKKGMFMKL